MQPAPSVWVWEVTGKIRPIYLMGELHGFQGPATLKIDHSLGEKIYSKSGEIWIEPVQSMEDKTLPITNLENRIAPETWSRVTRLIRESINALSTSSAEKKVDLTNKFFYEINLRDPMSALVDLKALQFLKERVRDPLKNLPQLGLNAHLKRNRSSIDSVKILDIEKTTSLAESWRNSCTDVEADYLIGAGLDDLEFLPISYELRIQKAFLQHPSDLDNLLQVHMNEKIGNLISKCAITPRNYQWLPSLIKALEGDGPPVTFLVGIGHLWGDEGLITLIKKQGYTNIKRIYSVE